MAKTKKTLVILALAVFNLNQAIAQEEFSPSQLSQLSVEDLMKVKVTVASKTEEPIDTAAGNT